MLSKEQGRTEKMKQEMKELERRRRKERGWIAFCLASFLQRVWHWVYLLGPTPQPPTTST